MHFDDGSAAESRRVQSAAGWALVRALARAFGRRGARLSSLALLVAASPGTSFGSLVETPVALPAVPPPHVRLPGAFDERGCALLSPQSPQTQRLCPAPDAATPPTNGWSRHLGYAGPRVATRVGGSGVVLLADTLSVAPRGWWRAAGLVRNETTASAREVTVTVILAAADDRILGTATALVPVRDVRPDEPAPFELRTLVPAEAVRRIEWHVRAGGGAERPSARVAEIEIGRIGPDSLHRIPAPSNPLVSEANATADEGTWIGWGILRNWGPELLEQPGVVGMWIDEHGRAVRMVRGRFLRDADAPIAVPPRATRTFELFEREPDARHGAAWRLALWQT
jgi:hypothetical protein